MTDHPTPADTAAPRPTVAEVPLSSDKQIQAESMLDVQSMTTTYGARGSEVQAVNRISFSIPIGTRVGLVGQSGSGKSSVIRGVLGLLRAPNRVEAEYIRFAGVGDLSRMSQGELRRLRGREIGYVGQNPFGALHPVLSVGAQCHQFLKAHGQRNRRQNLERAAAALTDVGIPDPDRVLRGHAGQLSGGMAQRTVIAISTMLSPRLLIADEPTTALDVTVQRQVLDLIAPKAMPDGQSLMLVTHDLSVVAQYCDHVIVMNQGSIMETGTVRNVFKHPQHPYTASLLNSVPRRGRALLPADTPDGASQSTPDGSTVHDRRETGS